MAGTGSVTSGGTTNALTSQQLQQLQQAVDSAFSGISGGTTNGAINSTIVNALTADGWSPQLLQDVQTGDAAAEGTNATNQSFKQQGSSAAPFEQSWLSKIENAVNGTGLNASATNGSTPASATNTQANLAGVTPTASDVASLAPASYSSFGTLPTVATSTADAAQVGSNDANQYLSEYSNLLTQEMAPTNTQQQEQLNESLAQRGIFNSGAAVQAQNDLTGQQDAALDAGNATLVNSAMGNANTNANTNAQLQQTANLDNAASTNLTNEFNATNYLNTTTGNENDYNSFLNELLSSGSSEYEGILSGYLNSYAPNDTALTSLNTGLGAATNAYTAGANGNAGSGLSSAFGNAVNGIVSAATTPKTTTPTSPTTPTPTTPTNPVYNVDDPSQTSPSSGPLVS